MPELASGQESVGEVAERGGEVWPATGRKALDFVGAVRARQHETP
jgi:hypothetical protein